MIVGLLWWWKKNQWESKNKQPEKINGWNNKNKHKREKNKRKKKKMEKRTIFTLDWKEDEEDDEDEIVGNFVLFREIIIIEEIN